MGLDPLIYGTAAAGGALALDLKLLNDTNNTKKWGVF
jgi:hypothetical protein